MERIGKSYPIHDAYAKVTGKAKYAGDIKLDNMLHVAVLFSEIPHGKVLEVDSSEALGMEGVVAVLDPFNTTKNKYSRYKTRDEQNVELTERIFAEHVKFVGDPVAAVVAETEEFARKAVKKIKVKYEKYDFALTIEEALAGKNSKIANKGVISANLEATYGDKNIDCSDCIKVETKVNIQRLHHATMETHACVVDIDFSNDSIIVYSPNQSVFGVRTLLSNLFEIPNHKVRVVKTTMGGSFGAKQEWLIEPIAVACALKVERPVRLVYNREECMTSTIVRAEMKNRLTTYFQKNGKLKNAEVDVLINKGAYEGNSIPYIATMLSKYARAYRFENLTYRGRAILTNTPVSGAFRGWTAGEAASTIEHNFNEAAKLLNIDPVELRLRNCMLNGEKDLQTGVSLDDIRMKECILLGKEKFEWDKRKELREEFNKNNERYKRGIGIGCGGHVSGFYPKVIDYSRVDMKMTDQGKIIVNTTIHDHGCGTVTVFKIITAEIFDIPLDDIQISEGDTEKTPYDLGCYSSRTTYVVGKTAQNCAIELLNMILKYAAKFLKTDPENLYVKLGNIYSKRDKEIKLSYKEVVFYMMYKEQIEAFVSVNYKNESNPGTVAAQFAEVEVDTYSGMVKVLKFIAVHDIGKALNREMCIAQIQGSVVMGIGSALSEHFKIRDDGKPFNSLKDYHVINSYEIPETEVYLIEDQGNNGPFGAKSIGEVAIVPVAATISGAVNDALGSSIGKIPLNPDTIVEYLHKSN
ncbi:MAG: molybdopterin cofactor-binding domain-containing protein [Fusobacterium gastrosuis]|uniref:xanthine dehydrogenase family protein molybdopterin-binding subunit n=1 Tax=Fusobacterium gastrosuis TaxID=1755100 RepID=UPI002A86E1CC|nr:molybdopterin cofactor-binding domain-containing protein [Fusobacterium gastrosuis]